MPRPSTPPWASVRTLLLAGSVGLVGAVGVGAVVAAKPTTGPTIDPVAPVVDPAPAPVVEPAVVEAVAPVASPCPDADSTACQAENAALCPDFYKVGIGLAPVPDWQARARAAGYLCSVGGSATKTDCGSDKLAGLACLEAHASERSAACLAATDCRADLNAKVIAECKPGSAALCPGVQPSPGSEPWVDCLTGYVGTGKLTSGCELALAQHAAAKPSGAGKGPRP